MKSRFVTLALTLVLVMAFVAVPVGTTAAQDEGEIDCMGAEGTSFSLLAIWTGEEESRFRSAMQPLLDACDLEMNYEGTRDVATVLDTRVQGGDAPDIAALPNPGLISVYADELVPLSEVGFNADNYPEGWKELGTVNGTLYAFPIKTDIKSLVWYSPAEFEAAGYEVPQTWEEFQALLDQISSESDIPALATGFESGTATGWTGTDFVQDILLRTQGAEFVSGLATGETAWNDPAVVEAWNTYADWVNQYGAGSERTISTPFADAVQQPFNDPPEAWMVRQSGFAGSSVIQPNNEGFVYGEDFAFFPLPGVGGEAAPMQVGGDYVAVFNNTPAVTAVVNYLSSAQGANAWAASGFDLTPNTAVDVSSYPDPISADKARALQNASDVSFDVGDRLPGGLNTTEFSGVTGVVGGDDAQTVLDQIQAEAEQTFGGMEMGGEEMDGGMEATEEAASS